MWIELGPCSVTQNLTTVVNEYSWSEASNLLFISQPLGVGFSYSEEEAGSQNPFTGEQEDASYGVTGEWPVINATELSTTDLAAVATWHVLQGFLSALPQLDGKVANKTFNLLTESYGGVRGFATSLDGYYVLIGSSSIMDRLFTTISTTRMS